MWRPGRWVRNHRHGLTSSKNRAPARVSRLAAPALCRRSLVGAYFVRRILIAVPVLIGITIAAFFVLAAAPGDPILARMDPEVLSRMTDAQLDEIRHNLGLDQPIPVRYLVWLGGVIHGDF